VKRRIKSAVRGQGTLDEGTDRLNLRPNSDKYRASLELAAIGDALGWPTEFVRPHLRTRKQVSDFVRWEKLVGGRWWGYRDVIEPGQYSDDTQLSLAISRCIDETGLFSPERFAYLELPLWLHYERGGGRSVKAAARSLITGRREWSQNFYNEPEVNYFSAGGNGSAMRNLPISLSHPFDQRALILDSFANCIVTHGHPRAIIGTVLFGLAVRHAFSTEAGDPEKMVRYLARSLQDLLSEVKADNRTRAWADSYNGKGRNFGEDMAMALGEALASLNRIKEFRKSPPEDYYKAIGALSPETKGSGISSTCAAIYQYLNKNDYPEDAILSSVNMLGSDTDTISSFTGALLGAQYGPKAVPQRLLDRLQDRSYIDSVADDLFKVATSLDNHRVEKSLVVSQREASMRILAWEVGLHEMFWDAIGINGMVVHPALGRGKIVDKRVEPLLKQGFEAKLLEVKFESGQSCIFHSRVRSSDGQLSESFAKEISKSLGEEFLKP
jgi:ADP-ribosylglycohydrolase